MTEVLLLLTLAMPPPPSVGNWQMAGSHRVPESGVNHAEARDVSPDGGNHVRVTARTASAAADSTPIQDDADDRTSRVDLGLGVISLSAAMIATGLTSSCLAAKTCHETVPLTRWAFDRGPVWGVVGRAGVSGLTHYAVARWVPKGKWRTATLATLAVLNVTNAVLDIRTLQKIEKDAGR